MKEMEILNNPKHFLFHQKKIKFMKEMQSGSIHDPYSPLLSKKKENLRKEVDSVQKEIQVERERLKKKIRTIRNGMHEKMQSMNISTPHSWKKSTGG